MAEVSIDIAKETSVEAVKGDTAAIKTDVTAVKGDVSTVKSDVSTVKTNVLTVKTNVANIKSKTDLIGSTSDTGGSTTSGTVMGKLNKLISDSGSTSSVPIIKSVQRGTTSSSTVTLQHTVNPDKCIVLLENEIGGQAFTYPRAPEYLKIDDLTLSTVQALTETTLTIKLGYYYKKQVYNSDTTDRVVNPTTYQIIEFY